MSGSAASRVRAVRNPIRQSFGGRAGLSRQMSRAPADSRNRLRGAWFIAYTLTPANVRFGSKADISLGPVFGQTRSFDHLVGPQYHARRDCQTERLSSLQIKYKLILGGLFNRQISRLGAFENLRG